MKRALALVLVLSILLTLCSCTSASSFYGVWYREVDGIRDVFQFAENREGKPTVVWRKYNIKNDSVDDFSITGFYRVSGDQIIIDFGDDTERLTLDYELDGDNLTLKSDTVSLKLVKFELED